VKPDQQFEELYRGEYAPVFRTTYLMCRSRTLAEDVTQEAFARALAQWGRLRDKPWVAGWVTTTALNVARRNLRHRRVADQLPPDSHEADASIDLWQAVRSLPLRQQQAVVLRYRMDMAVEEIAQVLGCEASSVRSNLTRARQHLREVLGSGFYAGR
jgi:RNA polymerase sigma factor (sigma-70 family)